MFTVLNCVFNEHDVRLVILAAVLCGAGSWVASRLFRRSARTSGKQRVGWLFLTSIAAGVATWCTHFVAMLGFQAGVPVAFDPLLTAVSLLIAVAGGCIGFAIAGIRFGRYTPALGGAVVGVSVAAMHYTGMVAYRVQGLISWDQQLLTASIVLSVALSALALHVGSSRRKHALNAMAGLLALAIFSLHFTGMAAFHIEPMLIPGAYSNPEALKTLALAITGMALVIVAAGAASYLIDDSTRTESFQRLRSMALTDVLTGLPNRGSFDERLRYELAQAVSRESRFALISLDLDRFKEINDTRGHVVGDQVLRELGRRMKSLVQDGGREFACRIGGDEFAFIAELDEHKAFVEYLSHFESVLTAPMELSGIRVSPEISIGVAIFPQDAQDGASLIIHADLALYRAKADILQSICFYDPSMDQKVKDRRRLAADLRDALERGQLRVHYQVQTSMSDGKTLGYEALLRWEHPQLGPISPAEFIPIAEENGLILELGQWVLETACIACASWSPPYKVAVNLSPVQFLHSDLPSIVQAALDKSGLAPGRLELELTETAIFTDKDRSLRMLSKIRGLGVRIALDDFGTGYSSLDILRSFPFDKIKIDGSFTSEVEFNPQARAIVRAVLALGKSLGIPVLAEGIETQGQLTQMTAEGCDEAQGFLLGRPAPLSEMVNSGQVTLERLIPATMTPAPA